MYVVGVMNDTHVIGHVPWKISFMCLVFLCNSGIMACRITGPRQYSTDLHQGGLEVLCQYQFYSENEECLKKVKELIEKASFSTKTVTINTKYFQTMKVTKPTFSSSAIDNHEELVVDPDETEYIKDKIENPIKKMKLIPAGTIRKSGCALMA